MWEGRKGRMLGGGLGKGRVKGGKEERKGGECKVEWMNKATRKTAKWARVSVGNCFVRLS